MFGKKFQRTYALTDQGVENTRRGAFWTVITNLVVMGDMGILYLLMGAFMETLTEGAPLPGAALFAALTALFVLLSFLTHYQQYKATYGLVYGEVQTTRLRLAERLRKLPLGYFGKRDLADLTETLMGDVNRMEHVWSHVLGYLYGAYISTAIIAVCLFFYDWRLAIACLWGVPVAFGLLFGSRKMAERNSAAMKAAALRVSDGIQEALENVREIRAANQEERYLAGLNEKIDQHEKVTIRGELTTGLFVNAASVIMRLGVATTILTGAKLILSGKIDFMLLFLFLGAACLAAALLSGCVTHSGTQEKLRDLEFTVLDKEDVPQEMKQTCSVLGIKKAAQFILPGRQQAVDIKSLHKRAPNNCCIATPGEASRMKASPTKKALTPASLSRVTSATVRMPLSVTKSRLGGTRCIKASV